MIAYITELTDLNFKEFVNDGTVLVDVKAVWCSPCKQLEPIIDDISSDLFGKLKVGKLDADNNPEIISELEVRSIPTILVYKNGELVERKTGVMTKKKIVELVEQYL